VQHIENITNSCVENVKNGGLKGLNIANPLSSLDFDQEQNAYQEIGSHLKDKYDTTKDPNTWVP
jgi:hypothetical protein